MCVRRWLWHQSHLQSHLQSHCVLLTGAVLSVSYTESACQWPAGQAKVHTVLHLGSRARRTSLKRHTTLPCFLTHGLCIAHVWSCMQVAYRYVLSQVLQVVLAQDPGRSEGSLRHTHAHTHTHTHAHLFCPTLICEPDTGAPLSVCSVRPMETHASARASAHNFFL